MSTAEKGMYQVTRLVWFIVSALEILLLFRFLMRLLGANAAADFTQIVYRISDPFISPFRAVFPTEAVEGNVFEWGTLLAIIVYWFLAWLIVRILLLARPVDDVEAHRQLDAEEE